MNDYDYLSGDPDKCPRQPGAPAFFKRVWNPAPSRNPHVYTIAGPITIYGFSVQSHYEEDQEPLRYALERGRFQAWCASAEYPEGELGMVPISEVTEIERADFDAARERGWKE